MGHPRLAGEKFQLGLLEAKGHEIVRTSHSASKKAVEAVYFLFPFNIASLGVIHANPHGISEPVCISETF